jgi:fructokinase
VEKYDIICAGEVLIDFIGHEVNTSITWAKDYHRFLGSPTNVAVNGKIRFEIGIGSYMWSGRFGRLHCRKLNANAVVTSYLGNQIMSHL